MTVKELIKALAALPGDAPVVASSHWAMTVDGPIEDPVETVTPFFDEGGEVTKVVLR